jgi:hypothetical protein
MLAKKEKGRTVLVFSQPGKEPTEHLFQELLQCYEEYEEAGIRVLCLTSVEEELRNPTLCKLLEATESCSAVCCVDEAARKDFHRSMEVGDERRPFVIALDPENRGLYAAANYNIDMARTLLLIHRLDAEAKEATLL